MRFVVAIMLVCFAAIAIADQYTVNVDGTSYTVSVTGGLVYPSTSQYTPEGYGAVGDGETNDAAALQAMLDAAATSTTGARIEFPSKTYYIGTTGLTVLDCSGAVHTGPRMVLDFGGATILADSSLTSPILSVGNADSAVFCIDVIGGKFKYDERAWNSGKTCILVQNAYDCTVLRSGVENGYAGVELRGSQASGTAGCAYNTVDVMAQNCLNAFYLNQSDADSWVNENIIMGRCQYSSALSAVDCGAGFAVNISQAPGTSNRINGNKFFGVSLEAHSSISTPPLAVNYAGNYNEFYSMRIEGFDKPYFTFDSAADGVKVIGGRDMDEIADITDTYARCVQFMGEDQQNLPGGSSTDASLRVANKAGAAYPTLSSYNADMSTATFVVDGNGDLTTFSGNMSITSGTAAPNGSVTANPGSIYLRTAAVADSTLYVKETGTGNTGWVAK